MTYKLYFYEFGNLVKFGKGKTGTNKHEFKTFEECEKRVEYLLSLERHKKYYTQFVIVGGEKIIKIY